jgi:hypothetical protein
MAGNGKKMAEAGKEENTEVEGKARRGRGKVVAGLLGVAETTAATKRRRTRASTKDGAEMLKQASDQALVEITGDIVKKLKDGAKEGNVVCVKTLMHFSETKKPRAKRKKTSELSRWMNELYCATMREEAVVPRDGAGGTGGAMRSDPR